MMVRYLMIAAALKMFSASSQTKRLYRFLGNTLGAGRRTKRGLTKYHLDRAKLILNIFERHHAIQDGDKLIEIGTGWVHWESTILRLFYDVEITLFDVWDNRQLLPLKRMHENLAEMMDKEIVMSKSQREHVQKLSKTISSISSFEALYRLLGFEYVIDPSGTLNCFEDELFDAIFSFTVLEHIDVAIVTQCVQNFYRLLKPGGYSIHVIDISDHLSHYDPNVSRKNYLRFSDTTWMRFFENDVQYFNRVQYSDWLSLFRQTGLELVEEESILKQIDIKVDRKYRNLDRRDLDCTLLTVVHRKPL